MHSRELVAKLAKKVNLPKNEAAVALREVFNLIGAALDDGHKIVLPGFGVWDTKAVAGRTAKAFGKVVQVQPKTIAVFRPSAVLRKRLATSHTRIVT